MGVAAQFGLQGAPAGAGRQLLEVIQGCLSPHLSQTGTIRGEEEEEVDDDDDDDDNDDDEEQEEEQEPFLRYQTWCSSYLLVSLPPGYTRWPGTVS